MVLICNAMAGAISSLITALSIRRQGSTFLQGVGRFASQDIFFGVALWRECGQTNLLRTIYHTMVLTSYNLSIFYVPSRSPEQPKRTQHVQHKQSPINPDPEGTSP